MEQIRVPEAAPEWPSVELGIGEKGRAWDRRITLWSAFNHGGRGGPEAEGELRGGDVAREGGGWVARQRR